MKPIIRYYSKRSGTLAMYEDPACIPVALVDVSNPRKLVARVSKAIRKTMWNDENELVIEVLRAAGVLGEDQP